MNTHTFKQRQFVLQGERLFYYKKEKNSKESELFFNLISLKHARIFIPPKPTPQELKLSSMYKYSFFLENESRAYRIATKSD
mmetsp:Transcript_14153/g.24049  ORF Transcript_14153/g.24049 Transcript_14153/m.24049 type:complete len:82 (-) Transcript_14153:1117-1362(-)